MSMWFDALPNPEEVNLENLDRYGSSQDFLPVFQALEDTDYFESSRPDRHRPGTPGHKSEVARAKAREAAGQKTMFFYELDAEGVEGRLTLTQPHGDSLLRGALSLEAVDLDGETLRTDDIGRILDREAGYRARESLQAYIRDTDYLDFDPENDRDLVFEVPENGFPEGHRDARSTVYGTGRYAELYGEALAEMEQLLKQNGP